LTDGEGTAAFLTISRKYRFAPQLVLICRLLGFRCAPITITLESTRPWRRWIITRVRYALNGTGKPIADRTAARMAAAAREFRRTPLTSQDTAQPQPLAAIEKPLAVRFSPDWAFRHTPLFT
jgi:hypothetical protein